MSPDSNERAATVDENREAENGAGAAGKEKGATPKAQIEGAMKNITLFNAFKKTTWKIKALDVDYARLYAHEDEKIANWRKARARYERLGRKLNFRLSYFLEWGKMPKPTHCIICGWWDQACGCDEFHAPAGYDGNE